MKYSVVCLLAILFAYVLAVPTLVTPLLAGIHVKNAIRNIDISKNIEIQFIEYDILNSGNIKNDYFIFPVPASKSRNVGLVEAGTSESDLHLSVERTLLDEESQKYIPEGASTFRVKLAKSLQPNDKIKLFVKCSFTHTLVARPEYITQGASQYIQYTDGTLIYGLYPIDVQRTKVIAFSSNIESFTPAKLGKKQGSTVLFGPFANTSPLQSGDVLSVYASNNSPFGSMKTAVREFQISHWGQVYVSENYMLTHNGAKLQGEFNRASYERSPTASPSSFEVLSYHAPLAASDIFFRDAIGNISTSHVRLEPQNDRTHIDIIPRYPLFGGWSADLELGFGVPLEQMVKKVGDSDKFVLEASFGVPFENVSADNLVVRVVLPEGANNIQWDAPFGAIPQPLTTLQTYLTIEGRTVLELHAHNIVAGHWQPLRVTYTFTPTNILRQPLLLCVAFFILFLTTTILSRLDLSLGQGSINTDYTLNVAESTTNNTKKNEKQDKVTVTPVEEAAAPQQQQQQKKKNKNK